MRRSLSNMRCSTSTPTPVTTRLLATHATILTAWKSKEKMPFMACTLL